MPELTDWTTDRVERGLMPKDKWGPGQWEDEPDLVVWRSRGLVCVIRRSAPYGILCGYVLLPKEHPLYGIHYQRLPDSLSVHGGITFSRPARVLDKALTGWALGFDCGHGFDYQPGLYAQPGLAVFALSARDRSELNINYRPLGYVRQETENLAAQLAAIKLRLGKRQIAKRTNRERRAIRRQLLRRAGANYRWTHLYGLMRFEHEEFAAARARIPRSLRQAKRAKP